MVPAGPVLRSRGTSEPSASSRAARRASVSSIRASSPLISAALREPGVQPPRQPDRLLGQGHVVQIPPGGAQVALGEDHVQHLGDRDHAVGQLTGGEGGERGGQPAQPGLGPADPLRHRGFGDEERPRDLGGGQTADGAQGEGDPAGSGQVGVTAQQQQCDRVVDDAGPIALVRAGEIARRQASAAGRRARARSGPARTAPGRSTDGTPRWSARRPGGRGRLASATAGTPPAGPPAERPRRRRSRRTAAPGPRGPAARGPATGPREDDPSSSATAH